jgi:cytochrome c553
LATPEHLDSESNGHPAVVASPVGHHQQREAPGIGAQTDIEVWNLPDEDTIGTFSYTLSLVIILQLLLAALRAVWRPEVYDHYDVSQIHECAEDGSPSHINFVFTCKLYLTTHSHSHAQSKTSGGTSNLQLCVAQCNKCHGLSGTKASQSGPPYS